MTRSLSEIRRVTEGRLDTPADLMRFLGMEPNPWQATVLGTKTPEGSHPVPDRGAGATTAAIFACLNAAMKDPVTRVVLVVPDPHERRQFTFDVLAEYGAKLDRFMIETARLQVRLYNGSAIWIAGDDPLRLTGMSPHLIVLDGANRMDLDFRVECHGWFAGRSRVLRFEGD